MMPLLHIPIKHRITELYKQQPDRLLKRIIYITIVHMVSGLYILFLSTLSLPVKLTVYLVPIFILVSNFALTFNSIIKTQQKLQSSQAVLEYIVAHDPLTGLYNRREFEVLLDKMISNSNRFNDQFALFVIDIDHFKLVNDTLGHAEGDEFIVFFSRQFNSLIRKEDTLSRIGGDEFTLITSKLQSPLSAMQLAERLVKNLNITYFIDGKPLTIAVSIGIAIYPTDGQTKETLLKNADLAMYQAKKLGKNTFSFY
jgi:diguanylate cyclase (GGDEF)-like protein